MKDIKPGQIWLDDKAHWNAGYDGEVVYIVKSKEPDEGWELVAFQEWNFGGFTRPDFTKEDINMLKYLGCLSDLKKHSIFRDYGFYVSIAYIITLILLIIL